MRKVIVLLYLFASSHSFANEVFITDCSPYAQIDYSLARGKFIKFKLKILSTTNISNAKLVVEVDPSSRTSFDVVGLLGVQYKPEDLNASFVISKPIDLIPTTLQSQLTQAEVKFKVTAKNPIDWFGNGYAPDWKLMSVLIYVADSEGEMLSEPVRHYFTVRH